MSNAVVHVIAKAVGASHFVQYVGVNNGSVVSTIFMELSTDDGHIVVAFVAGIPCDGGYSVVFGRLCNIAVVAASGLVMSFQVCRVAFQLINSLYGTEFSDNDRVSLVHKVLFHKRKYRIDVIGIAPVVVIVSPQIPTYVVNVVVGLQVFRAPIVVGISPVGILLH